MLVGLIIGELGLVLCTPAMVGLIARIGRILPLAPRIALRDAARNRAAAAPAISAVMAAVAGSVALGLYLDSDRAANEGSYYQPIPVGYASIYIGDNGITVGGNGNRAAADRGRLRAGGPGDPAGEHGEDRPTAPCGAGLSRCRHARPDPA